MFLDAAILLDAAQSETASFDMEDFVDMCAIDFVGNSMESFVDGAQPNTATFQTIARTSANKKKMLKKRCDSKICKHCRLNHSVTIVGMISQEKHCQNTRDIVQKNVGNKAWIDESPNEKKELSEWKKEKWNRSLNRFASAN
jgi:hypothetical protein